MDKNSAIGITLIAALLLTYFLWFAPSPPPPAPKTTTLTPQTEAAVDSTATPPQESDSVLASKYGELSSAMRGSETATRIETEDLIISFTNHGGVINELELKKFKTYHQKPLMLVTPTSNEFKLNAAYQGKEIDLYDLYYQVDQKKEGDTTVVTYSATVGGTRLNHVYKIPAKGYEIRYSITGDGVSQLFTGDNLTFRWTNIMRPLEKDLDETRDQSTITYYTDEDGFDELDQRSKDTETEMFAGPVQWVAMKEKFFLRSIIGKNKFNGGEIETSVNLSDSTVVKRANVKLFIPREALSQRKADLKFYFGPNDYQQIGDVAESFTRNVNLGWPPVYWINKFVIFPVFNLLTKTIGNYGLIIIILVFLLKLVLFPLSYKSYLSMAKMKVLKPELDEIKERVGDDMTKVQQEQMKLYSQVGVNPISGCVPVLLQMPILFAMFYLFPASIELRQQHFLWAEDLSTYDSIINFPFSIPFLGSHLSLFTVLMTASSLIYTWQNNQLSSVQGPMKSVSYMMPVIFLFVLNKFSAGLTFYYLVSNLVTFAQQAIIRRFVDENKIKAIMEENKKKNANGGTGKKSKFMSKLEDAMKASEEARKRADEERKKKKK